MGLKASDAALAVVFFGLSTALTWAFIAVSPLYISPAQMLLSGLVAGGKWGIQIVLALALLGPRAWLFIRNIGLVCLAGSVTLMPYVAAAMLGWSAGAGVFVGSLAAAVGVIVCLYFRATRKSRVGLGWWVGWMACLLVAVTLQLTVVFNVLWKQARL